MQYLVSGSYTHLDVYKRQPLDFSKKSIHEAVELSLKNLQTDYIDLYQMHWPERVMNMFGKRGVTELDTKWQDNFFEVLSVYDGLIKEGKIKHILSLIHI